MDLFISVFKSVVRTLYTSFYASLIFTILFMLSYIFFRRFGIKKILGILYRNLRYDAEFRKLSFLVFYTIMILFRTVLNRSYWGYPLENVIGVWGLYDKDGNLYTEGIENICLFIPWSFMVLSLIKQRAGDAKKKFPLKPVLNTLIMSFAFTLVIEMCQLFFKLGTFQLSDIFFNTMGGLIGVIIYCIYQLILNFRRSGKKEVEK